MADVIKRTKELEPELAFQELDRALLKSPIGRIPELYIGRPKIERRDFKALLNRVWLKSPGKTSEKPIEISFVVQDYSCRIVTHLICESIGFDYKIIGWASLY